MKIAAFLAVLAFVAGVAAGGANELLSPLDQAVNAVLSAAGVPNRDATRVVPVVTSGGQTAGYAQITGAQSKVAATRAVVKVSTVAPNGWTIDALIPVTTVNRTTGHIHREYGVAVDALVTRSL